MRLHYLRIGAVGVLAVVALLLAGALARDRSAHVAELGTDPFPPFTMVYEVQGPSDPGKIIRQRLDYISPAHWSTTVLYTESEQTVMGASFTFDGITQTWYDPTVDPSTYTADTGGAIVDPAPYLKPRDWENVGEELDAPEGRRRFRIEHTGNTCSSDTGEVMPADDAEPTYTATPGGGDESPSSTPECVDLHDVEEIEADSATGVPLSYVATTNGVLNHRFEVVSIEYQSE